MAPSNHKLLYMSILLQNTTWLRYVTNFAKTSYIFYPNNWHPFLIYAASHMVATKNFIAYIHPLTQIIKIFKFLVANLPNILVWSLYFLSWILIIPILCCYLILLSNKKFRKKFGGWILFKNWRAYHFAFPIEFTFHGILIPRNVFHKHYTERIDTVPVRFLAAF